MRSYFAKIMALESAIQKKIRKYLKDNGWIVIRPIILSESGWPDLQAIKKGRVIFFEVKRPGEKSEPLQVYRRKELIKQGVEAYEVDNLDTIKKIIDFF